MAPFWSYLNMYNHENQQCNLLITVASTEGIKSTSNSRGTEDSSHEKDLCPRTWCPGALLPCVEGLRWNEREGGSSIASAGLESSILCKPSVPAWLWSEGGEARRGEREREGRERGREEETNKTEEVIKEEREGSNFQTNIRCWENHIVYQC